MGIYNVSAQYHLLLEKNYSDDTLFISRVVCSWYQAGLHGAESVAWYLF